MSREQRRQERKAQARPEASQPAGRGSAPPNRRTPVRAAGGSGIPWVPIAVVVGTAAIVLLVAYLVVQARKDSGGLSASEKAQADASPDIPGVYIPPQGRTHLTGSFTPDRAPHPFCEGVARSASADAATGATPASTATGAASSPTAGGTAASTAAGGSPAALATATPAPTNTPRANASPSTTAAGNGVDATPTPRQDCYESNPPSSGPHLNVQNRVDLGNGVTLPRIPADPRVYDPDVQIPRDSIAHILEHAGVFVGYNCADGDAECQKVVDSLADLVNDRIDNHDDRVVMANDSDLPIGTMGVASWTRVLNFKYQDYDRDAVRRFIEVNSCRFDPEGFC